jgi:hypothetical protein
MDAHQREIRVAEVVDEVGLVPSVECPTRSFGSCPYANAKIGKGILTLQGVTNRGSCTTNEPRRSSSAHAQSKWTLVDAQQG